MQRKSDLRSRRDAARPRRRTPRPPGGKVLQRLFNFLGQRDPTLNDDVVALLARPKAPRPAYAMSGTALRAKGGAAVSRPAPRAPSARPYATAIVKAAARLTRRKKTTKKARAAKHGKRSVAPPGPAGVWQEIGPRHIPNGQTYGTNTVDVAGRVSTIAVDPSDPAHLLVASAGGGIWESTDRGKTWGPRTDQMPSLAVGAIAFDPTNPSRAYAGSGEGNFYENLGAGVYTSTDGGTTWEVAAASPFIGVGFFDLVVDPQTPSILYAATTNGFFKSTNSGATWSRKRTSICWDISLHPGGGSVELLIACGEGLLVSTNAGNSFTAVPLPSEPPDEWIRLGVDRVAASPDVAYVCAATEKAAFLWRRTGSTWKKVKIPAVNHNASKYFPNKLEIGQAQYDWYVAASPTDVGQVFIGAIDTFRGTLNGTTWQWKNITTQGANSIHPDQHCLTFAPNNASVIYAGNDGGVYRSTNGGATWKSLNKGLGICEIEYLGSDPNRWDRLIAGTQDNGTIRHEGEMRWTHVADGDGGDCGVNQLNPDTVYHSFYDVSLERSPNRGDSWTDLEPPEYSAFVEPPTSLFYPPVEVSGLTVAIGAKALVVTRNGKAPWDEVPLGLPAGDLPSAMREIDANTLLIGTTEGRMLRVSWNGTSWKKTALTSPASRYISCIAVDPSNPQRCWVTISQNPGRVLRSDDGGATWVNCSAGLPAIPMNSVVVDPGNFRRVWVAADVGVYQTLDLGASWTPFVNGLPNAMAVDLIFHRQDRVLVCATRNRGAWMAKLGS